MLSVSLIQLERFAQFFFDQDFEFGWFEHLKRIAMAHEFFLQVVGVSHHVGEDGVMVVDDFLLRWVQWQCSEVLGLRWLDSQHDSFWFVLVGCDAEAVFEELLRAESFWVVKWCISLDDELCHSVESVGFDFFVGNISSDDIPQLFENFDKIGFQVHSLSLAACVAAIFKPNAVILPHRIDDCGQVLACRWDVLEHDACSDVAGVSQCVGECC